MSVPRDLPGVYAEYCRDVSKATMALSLETTMLLWQSCDAIDAANVADFGSGWSSYVLRRWAQQREGVTVTSVDDDAEWMQNTVRFLKRHELTGGEMMLWDDYRVAPTGPHDVILHDLGGGKMRESTMPIVAAQVAVGGMAIFDDAHHEGHRRAMRRMDDRFDWIDVRRASMDRWGRFPMLGVRK